MDAVRSNILADLDSYLNGNNPGAGVMDRARTANANTNYDWISALGAPKKANSTGDSVSLFRKALEGIGGTSKLITNPLADITDSSKGGTWVDRLPVAIGNTLAMGAKAQVKDWLDGQLSWGDVPGFGALYGLGSQGKGFDATLKNLGAGEGVQQWGGLVGDMVLDPLNLVTLGGSSAIKAGKAAMAATKAELGAKAATEAGARIIEDAGRAARAGAQNAAFNFDVPFTKITKQFGSKPDFLKVADKKIGGIGAAAVDNLLQKAGLTSKADQTDLLNKVFKVNRAEDVTQQGLKFLQDNLDKISKNQPDYMKDLGHLFDGVIPAGTKPVNEMLKAGIPRTAGVVGDLPQLGSPDVMKALGEGFDVVSGGSSARRAANPNTVDVGNSDFLASQMGNFVQDMGGSSKLGDLVKNPFNARTFNSAETMVNKSAGDIRDTETKMFGQSRQMDREMQRISAMSKDLTAAERDMLPHIIEGAIPKTKSLDGMNAAKLNEVATALKNVLQSVGQRDFKSGTVKDLINNYFPHVLKQSDGDIASILKKYADDPVIKKVLIGSKANNFGKTRTSFDNLAQLDDHVSTLQTKLNGMPDGEAKIALQEKIDTLQNLFERDPIQAVSSRVYKSIRSSAMADLFNQFGRDGLLIRSGEDPAQAYIHGGYKKLNAEEAKKLGLGAGDMIHKEVYEGMQKVKDLVTDKGVQKFLDTATSITNIWKNLVTTAVPAHYFYNFIGNVANNTMAGVGIGSYKKAGELLSKSKARTLSGEEAKFMQDAVDKGVIGQGFSADFIKSPFAKAPTGRVQVLEDMVANNKATKGIRSVGDFVDDFSRLALFRHGYDQTGSVDKAAEMVRKYLFNYHEQTTADKWMRVIAPFWTWTKNNLPLQMQEFFRQPRFFSTYNKLKDTFNGDQESNMPGWMQESYFNIPGTNLAMNPRLPLSDLNKLGTGNPSDFDASLRTMFGDTNPLAKVPAELALNKQFYNGNPIDWNKTRPEDSYFDHPEALKKYLRNQSGILGKVGNIADGNILDVIGAFFGKPVNIK